MDQFAGVLSDQLCDDRASSGVLGDGAEDVRIEVGVNVDAKVFGDVDVGTAQLRHDPHKRQVGHVLHGSEKKSGSTGGEHQWEDLIGVFLKFMSRLP